MTPLAEPEAWQAGGPDTPACKLGKNKKLVAGDPALAFHQPHVQDKELGLVDGLLLAFRNIRFDLCEFWLTGSPTAFPVAHGDISTALRWVPRARGQSNGQWRT